MWSFIVAHQFAIIVGVVYVLTAAVNSLPDPEVGKFQFYPWLYHTTRVLLNNIPAKYAPKLPNTP